MHLTYNAKAWYCTTLPSACKGKHVKKVWVIEDDEVVQQLMAKLIERRGMTAVVSGNARQVSDVLLTGVEGFNLVILDLLLPDITGWDILKTIRTHPEAKTTPVVVMTGAELSPEEARRILLQANAFFDKKQFTLAAFDALLDRWL